MEEGVEVEVRTLQPEQEFVIVLSAEAWGLKTRYQWGRVLDHGVGTTVVELLEDGRYHRTRIAERTLVIPNE